MTTKKSERGTAMTQYRFMTSNKPSAWTARQIHLFTRVMIGLDDHTYVEIADLLNKLGLKTARGQDWNSGHVGYIGQGLQKFPRNEETLQKFRSQRDLIIGVAHQLPLISVGAGKTQAVRDLTAKAIEETKEIPTLGNLRHDVSDTEIVETIEHLFKIPNQALRRSMMAQVVKSIRT